MFIRSKKIRFVFVILFSFSGINFVFAEDPSDQNPFQQLQKTDTLKIDLQEAILMALEHNPSLSIQRLQPKIARTIVKEEGAIFDPKISASATKTEGKRQGFISREIAPAITSYDGLQYGLDVSETLPTGTTIAPYVTEVKSLRRTEQGTNTLYQDQFTGSVGIKITQALLQGFGLGTNLASLRQAKLDYEISKAELKGVAEEIIASAEKAYWDLYLTREEMDIQQRSLELANKQLKESQERVAVGKLPELELAAVHAEVATRTEALIDAQSQYEQARLSFLYLLNPSDQQSWATVPFLNDRPFVPIDTLDTIEVHEQLGMKYRPDLKQAQLSLKIGEIEITRTRNGLLPKLDFFITLGRTTYSQTFRDAVPDIKSPYYDINGGLTFNFPVTDRKAIAQFSRAKYTREMLDLSLKNMERLVQWDVRSAYIEVLRSREQITATRVARELQSKKLDAELEKFRVGKSTNFLVLQAQRDFTASQLNEARSMVAYLTALVDLYLMEGTLLERRGIAGEM